jgi:bifunctional non-homologous end joining protein LigD
VSRDVIVAGVKLTHADAVLWPDAGITRGDLLDYYAAVAPRLLPHLRGRPLTLMRCPGGVGPKCEFMKHSKVWAPRPIRTIRIPERTKVGEYVIVDGLHHLVALVQMDVVELHTWNTREGHVERPDRLVFDLDPGPEVPWGAVAEGARLLREVLGAVGLKCWVKTTGREGLHVLAPLVPDADWSVCLAFSRAVAKLLVHEDPRTFTTAMPKEGRQRRILVDYLRNNRTNTSVAAWSPRAQPGAPVSVPIAWEELDERPRFDLDGARARAEAPDPWSGYGRTKQRLADEVARSLEA